MDYEIDKLEPGYGASSDLLRYAILEIKGGGIYIDCTDVHPNFPLAKANVFNSHASHVLYVDDLAQNATPNADQLASLNLSTIGNDTFIVTKDNPLMKAIRVAAENNYTIAPDKIADVIKYAHASHHPKIITISRTGPGLVRAVIVNSNLGILSVTDPITLLKACTDGNVLIKKARAQEMQLTQPSKENTRLWLKAIESPPPPLLLEEAKRKALKAIDFEVEHFHYLRIEYHAETLARSLSTPSNPFTASEAFAIIASELKLKKTDFWEKIEYVPLTGACREALAYCDEIKQLSPKKQLSTLFDFTESTKQMILKIETNQFDISSLKKDLEPAIKTENETAIKAAINSIDKDIKIEVSKKIVYGCRFIEFIAQHPNKFTTKEDRESFCKLAKEILVQYNQINNLLLKAEPNNPFYQQNELVIKNALKSIILFGLCKPSQPSSVTNLSAK